MLGGFPQLMITSCTWADGFRPSLLLTTRFRDTQPRLHADDPSPIEFRQKSRRSRMRFSMPWSPG
jgi:hypothetical protein